MQHLRRIHRFSRALESLFFVMLCQQVHFTMTGNKQLKSKHRERVRAS